MADKGPLFPAAVLFFFTIGVKLMPVYSEVARTDEG